MSWSHVALEPFYLLVVIAVIIITNGLLTVVSSLSVLWHRAPPPHCTYDRRLPFLRPVAHRCLTALTAAVGSDYRVFTSVALTALIVADVPQTRQRRAAHSLLHCSGYWVDFLLCGAADHHPLCVILLIPEAKPDRWVRQRLDFIQYSCAAARLPVIEITEQPDYEPDALRQQISAAVARADVSRTAAADRLHADEEALLAALGVAMHDVESDTPAIHERYR